MKTLTGQGIFFTKYANFFIFRDEHNKSSIDRHHDMDDNAQKLWNKISDLILYKDKKQFHKNLVIIHQKIRDRLTK